MQPPKLIETAELEIARIDRATRMRPVMQKSVESLKLSIEEIGLKDEVHVRRVRAKGPDAGHRYVLLAGGHRCAAFEQLGRAAIPAKIWECTNDQAQLIEIDDNLAHAELDALDLAVFLARRKAVYERLYPETKRGSAGLAAMNGDQTDKMSVRSGGDASDKVSVASFVAATAEKMGVNERTVFRLLEAGRKLSPKEITQLREAPRKVRLADLQVIAKCENTVERYDICDALAAGTATSAKQVLDRRKAPMSEAGLVAAEAARLGADWTRASKAARRQFVRAHLGDLSALLDELAAETAAGTGEAADARG